MIMKDKLTKIPFSKPNTPRPPIHTSGSYSPRKLFEPIMSRPIELDQFATELTLHLRDADGDREIKTCYGDIYKIINALMDYARLLDLVCDEWHLQGYHRAYYEYHAEKLRAIAKKYQEAIGYDYDAAVEKCKNKKKRGPKDDSIGGDALELAMSRGSQKVDRLKKKG